MIDDLLEYNNAFVSQKGYEKYITNKYPDKKIAIVTCMDTRLTELLPASLGIKNGDVKMIKNAGGTITHPFGSAMRSLLVAIYELGGERGDDYRAFRLRSTTHGQRNHAESHARERRFARSY